MDAIRYIRERHRMCMMQLNCNGCPFYGEVTCVDDLEDIDPEKSVAIVEKWSNDHPIVTNRDKLLEVFGMEFCYSSVMKGEWLNAEYKEPKGEE